MVKLPDFIVIGAGKAGTTSLYDYLNQHPQIYLCPKKETFFFTDEKYRSSHLKYGAVQTRDEYEALFLASLEEKIVGEISTTYYFRPESAQLIRAALPEVKIIAILRNPIERAFSAYQMHVNNGSETRSFADVIDPSIKYVRNGFYYKQLRTYYEVFDHSKIKILFYEDYCADSSTFLSSIFAFVGADSSFMPDTSRRNRVGGVPKRLWVKKLLAENNPLRATVAKVLRSFMPSATRKRIREYLLNKNTVRISLDRENYAKLAEIYREDILKLQMLVDRDLSHWLSPKVEN